MRLLPDSAPSTHWPRLVLIAKAKEQERKPKCQALNPPLTSGLLLSCSPKQSRQSRFNVGMRYIQRDIKT